MLNVIQELSNAQAGGHGNHWDVFKNGTDSIMQWLEAAVQRGRPLEISWLEAMEPLPELDEEEPEGTILVYSAPSEVPENDKDKADVNSPGTISAVDTVVVIGIYPEPTSKETINEVWSAYPFCREGAQAEGVLSKVYLYPNRLEARIEVELTSVGLIVVGFDPLFCLHRKIYHQDANYRFSISALAYTMQASEHTKQTIDDPDKIRHFRAAQAWAEKHGSYDPEDQAAALEAWEPEGPEDLEPLQFETGEMTLLMAASDSQFDDDAFYMGKVISVTGPSSLFDTKFWRVDIALFLSEKGPSITVPVYVAEHSFEGDWRPSVGQFVTGVLWLQLYPIGPILH
jgi:hypothetical protein